MYKTGTNEEIGYFLKKNIESIYVTQREFTRKYIKEIGGNPEDKGEINRAYNKINDIVNGKKGVQLEDLPIFAKLLGVTCDLILSAGKYLGENDYRMSNYKMSFSTDACELESFIHRKDRLAFKSDEYGKDFFNYLVENGNLTMYKYLFEQDYIKVVKHPDTDKIVIMGEDGEIRNFYKFVLDVDGQTKTYVVVKSKEGK